MFDGAFAQMIEHLIAGNAPRTGNGERLIEIVRVEIADAPVRILPALTSSSIAAIVSVSGTVPRHCKR